MRALQNLTRIDYVVLNAGILRYPNVRNLVLSRQEGDDGANGFREQWRCERLVLVVSVVPPLFMMKQGFWGFCRSPQDEHHRTYYHGAEVVTDWYSDQDHDVHV